MGEYYDENVFLKADKALICPRNGQIFLFIVIISRQFPCKFVSGFIIIY